MGALHQRPGSIYVGNFCALKHRVCHSAESGGCYGPSGKQVKIAIMMRADYFRKARARIINRTLGPCELFALVNAEVVEQIKQMPLYSPTFVLAEAPALAASAQQRLCEKRRAQHHTYTPYEFCNEMSNTLNESKQSELCILAQASVRGVYFRIQVEVMNGIAHEYACQRRRQQREYKVISMFYDRRRQEFLQRWRLMLLKWRVCIRLAKMKSVWQIWRRRHLLHIMLLRWRV